MNKKLTAGLTLGLLVVAPFSSAMNAQEVSTNVLKETVNEVSKDLKGSFSPGTALDSMLSVDIDMEEYSNDGYELNFDNIMTVTANITAEKETDVNGLQAEVVTLNQQLNKDAYNVKVVDPVADVIAADTTDTFKAEISLNPDLAFTVNPEGATPTEMISALPFDYYGLSLTLGEKSQFYINENFAEFDLDGTSKTSVSSPTIDVEYDGDSTGVAEVKNTGSNTLLFAGYDKHGTLYGPGENSTVSVTVNGLTLPPQFTDVIILQPGETLEFSVTYKGDSLEGYADDTFALAFDLSFMDVFSAYDSYKFPLVESLVTVNFNEASTTTGGGDTTTGGGDTTTGGGDTTTDGGDTTTGDKPFVEQTSTSNTASTAKSTSPVLANTGKEISPIAITGLVSIIGFSILKFKNKLV